MDTGAGVLSFLDREFSLEQHADAPEFSRESYGDGGSSPSQGEGKSSQGSQEAPGGSSASRGAADRSKMAGSSRGVTRILFVIREPEVGVVNAATILPTGSSSSGSRPAAPNAAKGGSDGRTDAKTAALEQDEPCAMRALELVIDALAWPDSALQRALQPWTAGKSARLWCPEAKASSQRGGPRPSTWLTRRQLPNGSGGRSSAGIRPLAFSRKDGQLS